MRMYTSWIPVRDLAAASLLAVTALLVIGIPDEAKDDLHIDPAAPILAMLFVHVVLSERRGRRLESTVKANELQARALLELTAGLIQAIDRRDQKTDTRIREATDRHAQLSRDLKVDRLYFRDVLQDLGVKMDSMSALERAQFEVLREMNDTGENPVFTP